MPYTPLTRQRIVEALRRLGELASARSITLEVSLYGGAVFTLVYGSRDTTKDVDAIVRPTAVAKSLAAEVARELELPDDWLNDNVKQFIAEQEAKRSLSTSEFGDGIRITVPTAAYLLAMKLRACRPPLPGYAGDYQDIAFLVKKLAIKSVSQAETIYHKFFPNDSLSIEAQEVVRNNLDLSS